MGVEVGGGGGARESSSSGQILVPAVFPFGTCSYGVWG